MEDYNYLFRNASHHFVRIFFFFLIKYFVSLAFVFLIKTISIFFTKEISIIFFFYSKLAKLMHIRTMTDNKTIMHVAVLNSIFFYFLFSQLLGVGFQWFYLSISWIKTRELVKAQIQLLKYFLNAFKGFKDLSNVLKREWDL